MQGVQTFERAEAFLRDVSETNSEGELGAALTVVTRELGFTYFALTHHVDIRRAVQPAIRLHNYPEDWVEYYDDNSLGVSDPVHRASHVTSVGFAWSEIPRMIALTARDQEILVRGGSKGIGDGFTVPANVPIVQITGGQRSQVKVGTPVFMVVQKGAGGQLMAGSVSIGENGKPPPM